MPRLRILSLGEEIYSWTVLQSLPKRYYLCKCKCGNTSKVRAHDLLNNKSKSCRSCQLSISKKTHQQVNTPEYTSWSKMLSRCYNDKDKDYDNYGGRGITVCDAWRDSFEAFYITMGPAPKKYTIDREDYNGNYEPSNCRWADITTQNRNRSCNVIITYNNQTKTASEWLQELRVTNPNTYYKRLSRNPEANPSEMFLKFLNDGAKYNHI